MPGARCRPDGARARTAVRIDVRDGTNVVIVSAMNARPLLVLATLAAATSPDLGQGALERLKNGVRDGVARDPMGSVLAALLGGAWLFYRAERGHNPKVTSYYDALVYVSTCFSVGYGDIFARTTQGKAIGTALMTYGPAMVNKIFDPPVRPDAPRDATPNDVVARLDRILAALEKRDASVAG
jgi:hypothetical protein